jgi:hypothetical protein
VSHKLLDDRYGLIWVDAEVSIHKARNSDFDIRIGPVPVVAWRLCGGYVF